jgi:hypothetical protein
VRALERNMASEHLATPPRFTWAIALSLLLMLGACATESQPAASPLQTITFSVDFSEGAPTPQAIPAEGDGLRVAVRVYRSDLLAEHLLLLADAPHLPEPMYTSDEPHPVFGANVARRIRFNAQGVESELGGTTLFLLVPADSLQLSFQAGADLTLVATVLEVGSVGSEADGFPAGTAIAYGVVSLPFVTNPAGVAASARIAFQRFISGAILTPRIAVGAVFAGREYDFTLVVNLDVDGSARDVPGSDYTATYSLTNATPAPSFGDAPAERARGIRVLTDAVASPSELTVGYEVMGVEAAGSPAVFIRPVTYLGSLSLPFGGNGFIFDLLPPTVGIVGVTSNVLSGFASDESGGSGLATLRIFDGPQLIASSVAGEVDGALITFEGDAWSVPLTQLNHSNGDSYLITAIATDVAGNETRVSGVANLANDTFTPSDPDLR